MTGDTVGVVAADAEPYVISICGTLDAADCSYS
jgi:hypothetical protein